ncbi:hypothetical protein LJC74_09890, partial [Eubacteriales bacterium OttesenSCG-928-A19]|nr:hypothetical protein [Eubacteriales bacterium OttesenSCG-928-A19]
MRNGMSARYGFATQHGPGTPSGRRAGGVLAARLTLCAALALCLLLALGGTALAETYTVNAALPPTSTNYLSLEDVLTLPLASGSVINIVTPPGAATRPVPSGVTINAGDNALDIITNNGTINAGGDVTITDNNGTINVGGFFTIKGTNTGTVIVTARFHGVGATNTGTIISRAPTIGMDSVLLTTRGGYFDQYFRGVTLYLAHSGGTVKFAQAGTLVPPHFSQTLLGWDEDPDATVPAYPPDGTYNGNAWMLYAIWSALEYRLTLDANGGSFRGAGATYMLGPQLSAIFTLSGYPTLTPPPGKTLLGWDMDASATNPALSDGGTYDMPGTNVTRYAIWSAAPSNNTDLNSFTPIRDAARDAFQPGMVVVNCNEWVNVREGPGEEYAVIGRAYLHEPLQVVR